MGVCTYLPHKAHVFFMYKVYIHRPENYIDLEFLATEKWTYIGGRDYLVIKGFNTGSVVIEGGIPHWEDSVWAFSACLQLHPNDRHRGIEFSSGNNPFPNFGYGDTSLNMAFDFVNTLQ